MYPLHMKSAEGGFALANDENEHRALSGHGFEPRFEEPKTSTAGSANSGEDESVTADELTMLRAEAKAAGVKGGHLMGVEKLRAALGK